MSWYVFVELQCIENASKEYRDNECVICFANDIAGCFCGEAHSRYGGCDDMLAGTIHIFASGVLA